MRNQAAAVAAQFGRFCAVGLLSVAINNLFIVVLTELFGIHYLLSILICFVLATASGFVLNRNWSFRKVGTTQRRELIRYVVVTVGGICLSLLTSWMLMQRGIPYYVTMVGIALLMAPLNFIAHRAWSFGLHLSAGPKERLS